MYSCASEDQNGTDTPKDNIKTSIKPPAWILGNWSDSKGMIIKFTKSDIIIDPDNNAYSAKGEVSIYMLQNEDPEIVQTQTDSTYNLSFKESAYSKRIFKFIKISDNQIESKGVYKGTYNKK